MSKKRYISLVAALLCIGWLCTGSVHIFDTSYSTVVYDRDGYLLGAHISADEQWRFPMLDSVPHLFAEAIMTYEDKRYRSHPGVDVIAVCRAILSNVKAGRRVSGASTLTMQTIRLSRTGQPRTLWQKIIESALAVRLEVAATKDEILRLYASHAPYGGNVVGLETASWRYFQKAPNQLSAAEAAMLAVLPNAPSLVHLSKNRDRLLQKRNTLLHSMMESGTLDSLSYELAILEAIPAKPYPLPRLAPHLLAHLRAQGTASTTHATTIRSNTQRMVNEVVDYHHQDYEQSSIHNIAAIVLDTWTGEVLAYVGNASQAREQAAVDMVQARRSSGSVLKPMLYAHMINEGLLTPDMLIKDIPVQMGGFRPRNYDRQYRGAIAASQALSQSLNVPAVGMLHTYRTDRFLGRLSAMGITSLHRTAEHYGLSLIIGGGEVSLWELGGVYASMGRVLTRYSNDMSQYASNDFRPPTITAHSTTVDTSDQYYPSVLSAGAIYHTFEAMEAVSRPDQEGQWRAFDSRSRVAWKTGTSYGHRDAWAVGVTAKYTVAVWVGNADGEGIHGLVGVSKAAPVLFDIYSRLPGDHYFAAPIDDLAPMSVCVATGYKAGLHCAHTDIRHIAASASTVATCPYHTLVHMDGNGNRVHAGCTTDHMDAHSWLVLPPAVEYYYKAAHPEYRPLPQYSTGCIVEDEQNPLQIIYPDKGARIYIPTDLDGKKEKVVLHATHRQHQQQLHWHIDDSYIGSTTELHTMEVAASAGTHQLTVIDSDGHEVNQSFVVLGDVAD